MKKMLLCCFGILLHIVVQCCLDTDGLSCKNELDRVLVHELRIEQRRQSLLSSSDQLSELINDYADRRKKRKTTRELNWLRIRVAQYYRDAPERIPYEDL